MFGVWGCTEDNSHVGGAAGASTANGGQLAEGGSATGGSATGGSATGGSPTGGSAIGDDAATTSRSCEVTDVPGAPCEDPRCYGIRCGIHFNLICKDGAWNSADSSLAWEFSCPSSEPIYGIGEIKVGACCGELLPKNDVYTEQASCNLCPQGAPDDGAPCSLPDDCAPPVIDCFYKCCCYGTTIWAQCDGERWHVATNCSSK